MQLAFIKTESNFRPTARTQRKYVFGLIPPGRISSAYGYSQALDGTWKEYKKSTEIDTTEDQFHALNKLYRMVCGQD